MNMPWKRMLSVVVACVVSLSLPSERVSGQEKANAEKTAASPQVPLTKPAEAAADQDPKKEEAPADPFAVPEGSTEDLVRFIGRLSTWRTRARTREEFTEESKKRLQAVITATGKILEQKPEEKIEVFALTNQFGAMSALVAQFDPSQAERLAELTKQLEQDARPAIQKLPAAARLKAGVTRASAVALGQKIEVDLLNAVAAEITAYAEKYGVDRDAVMATTTLGRAYERTSDAEAGARLMEAIGEAMKSASDPAIASRAASMFGAARKIRLPGNFMEVKGKTADGQEFDWNAYRGKVVLVDFWASWCGPCLSELPNMKRNLARYESKGFAIVGINMDSTTAAFEKCVADKEIPWQNIVAEDEENKGWQHPLATYYGINAIPAAILVDKDGKVVSLRARGSELDRLLEQMLGPADEPKADEEPKTEEKP